jgi:eukaryotic-like serine/threonine-protein kinase
MSAAAPTPIGVIGHYNLLEQLEPSGPGDLYRARDTRAGRTVTVRVLPAGHSADPAARSRLLESAKSVIALSHPNIVTLYQAGEHEGRVFLAFEFLKGQSLRAEMAGRPMNVRRAVELAIQIADGIAEAHAAGYIHGGLSPETVVITAKGHAKIPAFELASRGGFEQTDAGTRLQDYDSPEEARGQTPDDRSDVYSVGAVLYEMLTTKRPMHRGAAAPSASNTHVFKELDDLVLRAVAPNPDSRIQSAATLAAELRGVAALLDARGSDDEEGEHEAAAGTGAGRSVALALAILIVLALIAYVMV